MITIQEKTTFPFYVVEAVSAIKEYLNLSYSVEDILRLAEKVDSEGIEIHDEYLDDLFGEIVEIPAVFNAVNTTDSKEIVEKAILIMLDRLTEENLSDIEISNGITQILNTIEAKLGVRFRDDSDRLLLDIIKGKMTTVKPLEFVPSYTENVILALTALETALKQLNAKLNQFELNKLLRIIGASAVEVDSFGEAVIDGEGVADESIDEADAGAKNRKVVRNGKIVTIKKRKKKMNTATRNKISRAMKKVKRKIKPSTIRKMLKSRAIRAKRGL